MWDRFWNKKKKKIFFLEEKVKVEGKKEGGIRMMTFLNRKKITGIISQKKNMVTKVIYIRV